MDARHRVEWIVGAALVLAVALLASGCVSHAPEVKPEPAPEAAPATPAAPVAPTPTPAVEPAVPATVPPPTFQTAYFDYNRSALRTDARRALRHDVDELLARPDLKVDISGHCDERGTDAYNVALGWKRAYAARDLLRRLGVPDNRLFPISYGRARPAVVGDSETAWAKNRRVEITVRS